MNVLFWGLTISVVGKILVAVGVLIAHSELAHEKRIDSLVIESFKLERFLTILGVALIVFGYVLEVYFYGFDAELLTCFGTDCATDIPAHRLPPPSL